MKECRTIRQDEAEAFLRLMCEVFELDYLRASEIFFTEPYYDVGRKWALFVDGEMKSILTFTPLRFGWGEAVGIAGVGTLERDRRKGYGRELIETALAVIKAQGVSSAYLFATKPSLYSKVGFQVLDEVVNGGIMAMQDPGEPRIMTGEEVRTIYDAWAAGHPDRLRRDAQRWKAWKWVYRPCEGFSNGYLCSEPMLCREAVFSEPKGAWPVIHGSRWVGLRSLARGLGVPLTQPVHELFLMGRDVESVPQMFMTDQF